jgi:hypothetical protein
MKSLIARNLFAKKPGRAWELGSNTKFNYLFVQNLSKITIFNALDVS